ncbi:MAG: ACP S-malonyltransferase [Succinivibrio sp.]|nr:ACP S-malonyltransferase [Succinivibrio sp.]
MTQFAAVFPGQGSQAVGMFATFMDHPEVARTYAEANEALGYDLKALTLNGPESELNKTEVTQPAILTASVAAFRALQAAGAGAPCAVAGHSLGEYSALVAAGVMAFADAVRLVRLRGQAMQEAVPAGVGAMAAVLGLDDEVIVKVCAEVSKSGDMVYAANFNTPGQVVISGNAEAVKRACDAFTEQGAKRVVPLAVSAPSHCPLMESAALRLKDELEKITLSEAKLDVYVNCSAKPLRQVSELKAALIAQLTEPVRWVQCVKGMQSAGAALMVECGPNKVLSGLIRRIDKSIAVANVNDPASLDKAVAQIKEG